MPPLVAGAAVIALALPVFVAAGWPLARLGARRRALGRLARCSRSLLTRLAPGDGNLAASGVVGFGMTFRAIAVMVRRPRARGIGCAARTRGRRCCTRSPTRSSSASSLALYFGGEPRAMSARSHLVLAVARPAAPRARARRAEEEEFNPEHEFEHGEWIPIHIGPLDLSINKAVAYLMLGAVCTIALGIVLMRVRTVGRSEPDRQAGARRDGLRDRADAGRGAGAAAQGDRPLVPLRRAR